MSPSRPWYETFFDRLYGSVLAAQFEPARSRKQAQVVKQLLGVRKGHRVLDVPCGHGRLTIPLARMGLWMTGVDRTEAYLLQARRAARKHELAIRFLCRDMRRIDFNDEFDGAFNWFGSFGYFSDRDNLQFCERVFQALKPGGRFLVQGINKSWMLKNFEKRRQWLVDGVTIRERNRWDSRQQRLSGVWKLSRGRQSAERHIQLRIYNGTEIRAVLRQAGFREIKLHGWPQLDRFTRHSPQWIAVGRHPL